ncbi:hypothetical protein [Actinosynnema sp. NPDC023587]|uniref:hypothetical protein n=1 Tax=Actinosynnema sp. NPDC023587 TaxID=3154695 RepID=UPI0033EA2321
MTAASLRGVQPGVRRLGVPHWNTGVDYRDLLDRSGGRALVRAACAGRVSRQENLRQHAVDGAGHCRVTASEEITAFTRLFARVDTGRWSTADPYPHPRRLPF